MRSYTIRRTIILVSVLMILLLSACGAEESGSSSAFEEHKTGSMDLKYADQFHVDHYEDGVSVVAIEDGLRYLLVPGGDLPDWISESDIGDMTVISTPVSSVYMAASSGMDLVNAAGGIDSVAMTSTEASDWAVPEIRELVESDKIHYVGKYRAPDYEALLEGDVDLAVESTMIYHTPQVKEAIEDLGIPVLVERSSYEKEPLGRLEWIRLYGLLFGRTEEADAFFDQAVSKAASVNTESVTDPPTVAFFSINSNGSVVVRKPGDYVTRMIEQAGGRYALDDLEVDDDNALSTMNMQMEAFYDMACDSDIIIYNSAIESDLGSISDLTSLSDQMKDFKAVKEGRVWCTNRNVFQKITGAADMISEMNMIFAGAEDDTGMQYFHLLK